VTRSKILLAVALLLALSCLSAIPSIAAEYAGGSEITLTGQYAYTKATRTSPETAVLRLKQPVDLLGVINVNGVAEDYRGVDVIQIIPPNAKLNGKTVQIRGWLGGRLDDSNLYILPYNLSVTATTVIPPVKQVKLNTASLKLAAGESFQLTSGVKPAGANPEIKWSSDKPHIATVDAAGNVTAVYKGIAVIRAVSDNGVTAKCKVTVTIPVRGVSLNQDALTIEAGGRTKLMHTVAPGDASNTAVSYASSDRAVATVDSKGTVTGKKAGSAMITVTTKDGGHTARCAVTVITPVRGVKLNFSRVILEIGETKKLSAVVSPANATDKSLIWSSGDEAVAKVDANGNMTALREGTVIVHAAAHNGKSASCAVTVMRPIDLQGVKIGINPGHQAKPNRGKEPIAPGSKTMKEKTSAGTMGVRSRAPESVVNLQIALQLRDILERMGAQVVMTRTSEHVDISNVERAALFNEAGVDLALHLHCDGAKPSARGIRIFARNIGPFAPESLHFAQVLMPAMVNATGARNGGVIRNNSYTCLNWAATPALLVEMGYLSNPEEDLLLNNLEYQRFLALGMAGGIADYLGRGG